MFEDEVRGETEAVGEATLGKCRHCIYTLLDISDNIKTYLNPEEVPRLRGLTYLSIMNDVKEVLIGNGCTPREWGEKFLAKLKRKEALEVNRLLLDAVFYVARYCYMKKRVQS